MNEGITDDGEVVSVRPRPIDRRDELRVEKATLPRFDNGDHSRQVPFANICDVARVLVMLAALVVAVYPAEVADKVAAAALAVYTEQLGEGGVGSLSVGNRAVNFCCRGAPTYLFERVLSEAESNCSGR